MNCDFIKLLLYILLCIGLSVSCATTGKLSNLKLEMTKPEVRSSIGKPTVVRGAMRNKYDEAIEVWEYRLFKTDDDAFFDRPTYYWLYFCNDTLVQWGEAGDWEKEADRIYDLRFRNTPGLQP
jgi:hypothetical protein